VARTGPDLLRGVVLIDERPLRGKLSLLFLFRARGRQSSDEKVWDLNLNKLTLYFYDEIAARWSMDPSEALSFESVVTSRL